MKSTILFLLVLFLGISQAYITSRNGKLYDELGRQIRFRGPNVVVKVPPYYPTTDYFDPEMSFSEQDIIQLKEWGFNGIRFGVMWAGVEPSDGNYSLEYLERMEKIVNLAGKYGIYSLVEFHQDLLSEKFCGDGVPTWFFNNTLSSTFPKPLDKKHFKYNASGKPDYEDCLKHSWGTYYFSYDVSYAFEALYTNKHNLRTKFINYWEHIVQTFKDNPYVLGYQIINQPFAGAVWKNPLLVVPSMAERLRLQQFYDKVTAALRKIDNNHPFCFEPVTWDNTVMTGFSHPPGGNKYLNQSIFCFHYYSPPALNSKSVGARVRDAKHLGVSSILSEFWYKGDAAPGDIALYNSFDQSWFFWGYKTFGKTWGSGYPQASLEDDEQIGLFYRNGTAIKQYVQLLSQTYVQRLDGEMIDWSYDHSTKEFRLSYFVSNKTQTIVYLNRKENYPNGYVFDVYPKNALKITEEETNYLKIRSNVAAGSKVVLLIRKL